jgi:hypothetical protein
LLDLINTKLTIHGTMNINDYYIVFARVWPSLRPHEHHEEG